MLVQEVKDKSPSQRERILSNIAEEYIENQRLTSRLEP
jgi:hypothetical protein